MRTLYTETSSLKTIKIMLRNLNEIGRSWIRLQLFIRDPYITLYVSSVLRCKLYREPEFLNL